jgi:HSP20 family molecular chaperone IbpA
MRTPLWRPPTDVYETEASLFVRVEIAGMREEDFTIQLDGRALSIRGARQDITERRAFYQMEIQYGEFSVEIELPVAVVPEKVEAVYANGILKIVLPKARSHHIRVES